MDNDCEDDLSMLYRLLRKVNALDLCVKHFREYVKVNSVRDTRNYMYVKAKAIIYRRKAYPYSKRNEVLRTVK